MASETGAWFKESCTPQTCLRLLRGCTVGTEELGNEWESLTKGTKILYGSDSGSSEKFVVLAETEKKEEEHQKLAMRRPCGVASSANLFLWGK
jgi:hypothetical protein